MKKTVNQHQDVYGVTYFTSEDTDIEGLFKKLYGMNEPINYEQMHSDDILCLQIQTTELLNSMEKENHLKAIKNLKKLELYSNIDYKTKTLIKALKLQSEFKYEESHNKYLSILRNNPKDRLAFFAIHMLEFNQGWQKEMLYSSKVVVNSLKEGSNHYGFTKGIESFSLIENGHFEEAKKAADIALNINPKDIYAIHAVCHYFYETGQYNEGIKWMIDNKENWISNKGMRIHVWWHLAVFYLFNLNFKEINSILTKEIMNKNNDNGLEDLDATSLIWRLYLLNGDISDYYKIMNNWNEYIENSHFIFNDLHALMAYIMNKDDEKIEVYFENVLNRLNNNLTQEQTNLLYGFYYYGKQEYEKSSLKLKSVLNNSSFGGSNAQRDVISLTLFFALLKSNKFQEGRELLNSDRAFRNESKMKNLLINKLGDEHHLYYKQRNSTEKRDIFIKK